MDSLALPKPAEPEIELSELNRKTLHALLRNHEHTKQCAPYFDPSIESHNDQIDAIIAFIKKAASPARSLPLPHFFEIKGGLCQDGSLSGDEFRIFVRELQSAKKALGILVLSSPSLPENPILRADYKPLGLNNLGNSCYINASLQLAFILAADIFHKPRESDPNKTRRLFVELMGAVKNGSENNIPENMLKRTSTLTAFEKHVRCELFIPKKEDTSDSVEAKPQMDASEFFAHLLDSITSIDRLREECNGGILKGSSRDISAYEKESLLLAERFAIRIDSRVTLPGKDHVVSSKKSVDSKMSVTVSNEHTSFTEALKAGLIPEIIENYRIIGASEPITVSKKTVLQKAGDFILFDFARTPETISKPIPFPLAGLSLEPYYEDKTHQENYELVGIVMHTGSLEGGHYISYVRGCESGRTAWFRCDDTVITPLTEATMLQIALDGHSDITYIDDFFIPTTLLYTRSQNPKASATDAHTLLMATNAHGPIEIEEFSCKVHADAPLHTTSIKEILLNSALKKKHQSAQPNPKPYTSPSSIQPSLGKNHWTIIPAALLLAILYALTNKKTDAQKAKKGKEKREKSQFIVVSTKHKEAMGVLDPKR